MNATRGLGLLVEMLAGVNNRSAVRPDDPNTTRVLCVDLDGTLLATDLLWETVLLLLKKSPWMVLAIPFWLLRGKANLKHEVARRVKLDASRLPYRPDLLEYLNEEKRRGRTLVLATASDAEAAAPVAKHLGIFSELLSSDGRNNLSGARKEQALIDRFGAEGFDYAGNDSKDKPVWRSARAAILVDAPVRLLHQAQREFDVVKVFPRASRLHPALKSLRAYQWCKNLLVFVPLAMAHRLLDASPLFQTAVAFVSLCMVASGAYLLNDLFDLPSDRAHPIKRTRPFASGALPISTGLLMAAALFIVGTGLAAVLLPVEFLLLLVLYLATTTAYSLHIKKMVIADIIALAGLYTLRILAGGFAAHIPLSFWLLAFSMFIFLSLACMKRYIELTLMKREGNVRSAGRAYRVADLRTLENMGTVSSFMSVLVLALFINSSEVTRLYTQPKLLWLACPALLYWIIRMWFRAQRGALDNDDPIVAAFKDKVSYAVALLMGGLIFLAS